MITQDGTVACKQTPSSQHPSSKPPIKASGVSDDDASSGSAKTSGSRKRRVSSVGTEAEIIGPSSKVQNEDRLSHEDHRTLVEAIFEVGLKNASPAVILENMTSTPECITSERVKSHLQKFRQNREKAKEEFMASYDQWISQVLPEESGTSEQQLPSPAALLGMTNSKPLGSGEMAASLTYSVLMNDTSIFSLGKVDAIDVDLQEGKSGDDFMSYLSSGAALNFPKLTKAEEKSSVGKALLHVQSMFVAITAQVEFQRRKPHQVKESERHSKGLPSIVDPTHGASENSRGQVAPRPQTIDKGLGPDVSNQRGTPGNDQVAQSLQEGVMEISSQGDQSLQGNDNGVASNAETQPGKSENHQSDQNVLSHDNEVARDIVKEAMPEVDGECAASSSSVSDTQGSPARIPVHYQPPNYAHPVEGLSPQNQQLQQQQLMMLHQHHHQQRHQFHLHQLRLMNRAPPWSNNRPLPPPPGRFGPPPPYHHARDSPRKNGS